MLNLHCLRAGKSIEALFGRFCSGRSFAFDDSLTVDQLPDQDSQQANRDTQRTTQSSSAQFDPRSGSVTPTTSPRPDKNTQQDSRKPSSADCNEGQEQAEFQDGSTSSAHQSRKRGFEEVEYGNKEGEDDASLQDEYTVSEPTGESQETDKSCVSDITHHDSVIRHDAYKVMRDFARGSDDWASILLMSTHAGHTEREEDLGSVVGGKVSADAHGKPKTH